MKMKIFRLKVKLVNRDVDQYQVSYIKKNIQYFIGAIKNSLAISHYCVHIEKNEKIGNYFLIHYETDNDFNILENRILEIQENDILGKYLEGLVFKKTILEIID